MVNTRAKKAVKVDYVKNSKISKVSTTAAAAPKVIKKKEKVAKKPAQSRKKLIEETSQKEEDLKVENVDNDSKIESLTNETSNTSFDVSEYLTNDKWKLYLNEEFQKDYFKQLNIFLANAYSKEVTYPPKELVFNAFNLTDLEKVRIF